MRCEVRKVDKTGCISFKGKTYDAGIAFAGQTVNIIYDSANFETITVEHEHSGSAFQVNELKIGVHTGSRPKLPKRMTEAIPETSRLLDEKEKRYNAKQEVVRRAISFKDLNAAEVKGGESDV
jgi:hypothetical protein